MDFVGFVSAPVALHASKLENVMTEKPDEISQPKK